MEKDGKVTPSKSKLLKNYHTENVLLRATLLEVNSLLHSLLLEAETRRGYSESYFRFAKQNCKP